MFERREKESRGFKTKDNFPEAHKSLAVLGVFVQKIDVPA
jgi:hypothetical protein